ncbi:hypothetical protein IGI04_029828 [Brassica rapa subsp. trilocularis]|uniref:Uncharacterized protein n=1 Tax=Brassica rapa subsp. trilocularis TaxID=1813537 RepID=A0ABQ7LPT8_BRACM|nr:hypothetical protein IGI04_029828 [Brassica rapa subsp. trilocularis]
MSTQLVTYQSLQGRNLRLHPLTAPSKRPRLRQFYSSCDNTWRLVVPIPVFVQRNHIDFTFSNISGLILELTRNESRDVPFVEVGIGGEVNGDLSRSITVSLRAPGLLPILILFLKKLLKRGDINVRIINWFRSINYKQHSLDLTATPRAIYVHDELYPHNLPSSNSCKIFDSPWESWVLALRPASSGLNWGTGVLPWVVELASAVASEAESFLRGTTILLKSKEPLAEESVIRFFDISAIGKPIQMDPRRRVESTQNLERLPNMIVTVAWIDVKPLHINIGRGGGRRDGEEELKRQEERIGENEEIKVDEHVKSAKGKVETDF